MSLHLELIRATEFVRVGAQGEFDLEASKQALSTLATACRKRGIEHALLDLRAVHPGPTPIFSLSDLKELVEIFPRIGFTKSLKLAILYTSDPHERARLFTFLSNMQGWHVMAFEDFEKALTWLSSGEESAPSQAA